jgi:hypothetical protein
LAGALRSLPSAAISSALQLSPQQSVDGLNGTLEIRMRSSYVPNSAPGVASSSVCEEARRNAA